MRVRRCKRAAEPRPYNSPLVSDVIRQARLGDYGDGVAHGMETTLRLLLGEPADGGYPCPGPLTDETVAWAQRALHKLEEAR